MEPLKALQALVTGTLNKITKDIREGAIAGFARHGSNGRGEGGFSGFCYYLAKKHPKAAARIVEKLLPLTVNANGVSSRAVGQVNIVSVPVGTFLDAETIAKMQSEPLLIEHEPQPEPDPIDTIEPEIEAQSIDREPEPETEPGPKDPIGMRIIRSPSLRHR